jgi:hypothetical protein
MIVPQYLVCQRADRVTATSNGDPVDIEWAGMAAVSLICNERTVGMMVITGILANSHSR